MPFSYRRDTLLVSSYSAITAAPSQVFNMLSLVVLVAAAILFGMWHFVFNANQQIPRGLKPLPGPKTRPIIGNAGQFDHHAPFLAFQKWAQEYGPIFQVKLGSQTYISVNDPVIAKELFEKRGSLYNSRNSTHVGYDLLSEGRRITFAEHGRKHTTFRKQLHNALSISKTKDNQQYQEFESRQVLQDFLDLADEGKGSQQDCSRVQQIYRY